MDSLIEKKRERKSEKMDVECDIVEIDRFLYITFNFVSETNKTTVKIVKFYNNSEWIKFAESFAQNGTGKIKAEIQGMCSMSIVLSHNNGVLTIKDDENKNEEDVYLSFSFCETPDKAISAALNKISAAASKLDDDTYDENGDDGSEDDDDDTKAEADDEKEE